MKILFTRFPLESALGGAETQTLSLMEGLQKRGKDIVFAGSCSILLRLSREHGIETVDKHIGPPPVTMWSAFSFLWRRKAMRQKLESLLDEIPGVNAIIMLSLSEKLLLTPLALKRGIRVYWVEHDKTGRWLKSNPWLPQLKALSLNVLTIAVSDLSRKLYEEMGWSPQTIVAIPNGIDTNRFAGIVRKQDKTDTLFVGTAARLSWEKGVDLLIEAVRDERAMDLTIVGRGRDEQSIRKQLDDHPRMRLLQGETEFKAFFESIDVFVLPSREHDPFGLVVAEAMSVGIPVIVTDVCGIAGYLTHGENAIIVKAGSVPALRSALNLLRDPEERAALGAAGEAFAREHFTLEKMINRYEEVLS